MGSDYGKCSVYGMPVVQRSAWSEARARHCAEHDATAQTTPNNPQSRQVSVLDFMLITHKGRMHEISLGGQMFAPVRLQSRVRSRQDCHRRQDLALFRHQLLVWGSRPWTTENLSVNAAYAKMTIISPKSGLSPERL